QTVTAEDCYCPACGMPQFQYSAEENASGQPAPEPGQEPVRDAGTVAWKPALRAALLFAVPAGVLSSSASPAGVLGLLWMSAAASWAVAVYVRSQRPAWITLGAGARIGLVTGVLAAWMAFAVSGGTLFVQRFVLHQSSQMDAAWKANVAASQQFSQQLTGSMGSPDAAKAQTDQARIVGFMLSPGGHAGIEAFGFASNALFLIFFGMVGGSLGARLMARSRRPEI